MDSSLSSEILTEKHFKSISTFSCSKEPEVENFLKEDAYKYNISNMARTRLFFDESHNLIGYFTVFNDHVEVCKSKRQSEHLSAPKGERNFPAIRLHYLGVDDKYQKLGYGEQILLHLFEHCYNISRVTGCTLITVQALRSSIEFYKKYAFVVWKNESKAYLDMFFKISDLHSVYDQGEKTEQLMEVFT
ncbi:GNAT family N-acetyltransferase [Bacillus wiedmannii]|uniref:GNAT family N-acetyltransferase n=1 Tax=Bacillus wiedmannii TaxID=1890302 RepID=UPI000BFE10F7|nr:GNAT family N-acetyltransferase [Bacillus wiedmannii]PHF60771.1 GNAT family N-acetyltransferase [Bacillus wiedmannii]